MAKPITKAQLAKRAKLIKAVEESNKPIVDRINYIIKTIQKVCKTKKIQWSLYYPDNGMDPFDSIIAALEGGDPFGVEWDGSFPDLIEIGNHLYLLDDGIPSHWLTHDFEDELIEMRQKNLEAVGSAKRTDAERKLILKKLSKKLSDKEKEILGLK